MINYELRELKEKIKRWISGFENILTLKTAHEVVTVNGKEYIEKEIVDAIGVSIETLVEFMKKEVK